MEVNVLVLQGLCKLLYYARQNNARSYSHVSFKQKKLDCWDSY